MKAFLVLTVFAFSISYGMTTSLYRQRLPQSSDTETTTEKDFLFNLLPLKILLEHKLRVEHDFENVPVEKEPEFKQRTETDPTDEKSKSVEEKNSPSEVICDTIKLFSNISEEEISTIFSGAPNTEPLLGKEQLEKIYDSLKNCYFVRVRSAKIWGPLWHCLNRLFLFFVFH